MTQIITARENESQQKWLLVVLALAILLQLELVFNRPINWDEFYHLSETHAFHQRHLTEALQVFYARAFFWLPLLPVDAVDQIRIARLFMLGFEMFTLFAIYGMARPFAGRVPAAVAALAYVTGGYVFQHGFSYRADPMAAAFLMGALWIVSASRLNLWAILGAGALAALATLTTIKVVLYAPAFLGIAWLRWRDPARPDTIVLRLVAFGAAALLFTLLFVGVTIISLPETGHNSAANVISISGSMMFDGGIFPKWGYGLGAVLAAPLLAVLLFVAPFALLSPELARSRKVALAALMLPLASLLFYRNAFPYFYAFILPPVMVGAAVGISALLKRVSAKTLSAALLVNALIISVATPREVLPRQKQVLAAVHKIFPEPVAYFDFPGMIAGFHKANFFMTVWGFRKYQLGYENSFSDVMAHQTVPLLVVNQEPIQRNQMGAQTAKEFLPADAEALRKGYIPHWGPLWVAGRRFSAGRGRQDFHIYTPGAYTLEGAATVRIDDRNYRPGDVITLARGSHKFERKSTEGEVVLRWGDHLKRPVQPYVGGPLFEDF